MKAFVFLGPSLPRDEAARILDAVYLPPIQQGDLLRLLVREKDHAGLLVGIVDGYFETVPAVWHKEILLALSLGVRVFGAASMGALRAAELHSFGMAGIGTIFSWFRDGVVVADDEVAVQHGPGELGYLPLSHALVDIRHGCARALAGRIIDEESAEHIVSVAQGLTYGLRTHDAIVAALRAAEASAVMIDAWQGFVEKDWTSLKANDAAAMLAAMRNVLANRQPPEPCTFILEDTIFLDRLRNEIAVQDASMTLNAVPGSSFGDQRSHRCALLLNLLANEAASTAGWEVTTDELIEEVRQLCAQLGLTDTSELLARLTAMNLSENDLWTYLRDELFVRRLMRQRQTEINRHIAVRMRLQMALMPTASSAEPR